MDYRIHPCWMLGVVLMFCLISKSWTQEANVIRFSSEETKEIIDLHNDLRRSVYNAANMRELTWNEAVALAASEWGSKCEYTSRPDNLWGQNMNYYHGKDYHNSSMSLFKDSFYAWANETKHYDYRRYKYCGGKNVCSYVQLIAADVQEVGCAVVKCPKLELKTPHAVLHHSKLLVCFYTPWVDILGSEVFIPDKRCAACPAGTSCVDNLCSARFNQPGARTLQLGRPGVQIKPMSGSRRHEIEGLSGGTSSRKEIKKSKAERRRERKERKERNKRRKSNRINGSIDSTDVHLFQDKGDYQEHRKAPDSYAIKTDNDTVVVYTPNNRVIPFPGKKEKRMIRKIEKLEKEQELAKNKTMNNSTDNETHNRKKRQVSYDDRNLSYEERLRRYERMRENRRLENYYAEQQRLRRQRQLERERHYAMALMQNEGHLTGEEQFFTISAHNLLRREARVKDLAWSSHLERWAKYVIRCETEYPGPITCYTNFGKADRGQAIYNVVYGWGSEGDDMDKPLRYGCRTPYDKALCNHNSIILESDLRQMACAAKNCGYQRQLTCIYSSG